MEYVELLGVVFGLFCTVLFVTARQPHKKSAETARWERDSEYRDWIIRGGTHEGFNTQNSAFTAGRERLRTWKPGIRIEK